MASNTTSTPTAGAGSHPIGKVTILYGKVQAIAPDGTVRVLGPNSIIYADERIVTDSDGAVSVMLDGPPPTSMDLGRMSDVHMTEDVYAGATPAVVQDASTEADKIQEALDKGDQPIELDATAAGAGGAGGAHPIVNFGLDGSEITPESGAGTTGVGFGTVNPLDGTSGGAPAVTTAIPTAIPDAVLENVIVEGEGQGLPQLPNHVEGNVLKNDLSGDAAITVTAVNGSAENVGVPITTEHGGTIIILADGSYIYTAPAEVFNENGQPVPDIINYTITNSDGNSATTTLTINITDTAPTAVPDTATVVEGGSLTVAAAGVLVGDTPSADGISVVAGEYDSTLGGHLSLHADGSYTYTAPAQVDNSKGAVTDTFDYMITDSDGSNVPSSITFTITDTAPTLDFTNSIGPVSSEGTYTGLWSETLSADIPNELSVALNGVSVGNEPVTIYTFDSATNTGSFTYAGGTVTFDLNLNPDGTYTLQLGSVPTDVIITPTEFSSAVQASGPTPTYNITYVDAATNTTLKAVVTVPAEHQGLTLVGATNASGTTPYNTYSAETIGTSINASSDGIGISNNIMNSSVTKSGLFVEGLNYNPVGVVHDVTAYFKVSGDGAFGGGASEDVIYFTLHGVDSSNSNVTKTIMLDSRYGDFVVNADQTLTPITGGYAGGSLTSYKLVSPEGWTNIESVDVTAGFYQDARGNIQETSAKVAFGFTADVTQTIDQTVHMDFTATLTDSDGSSDTAHFIVQTDTGHIFDGTPDADYITGTSGADTIHGYAGDDHIVYDGSDSLIDGGVGSDTLVVKSAAAVTINLANADQSSGDLANVIGFENVDAHLSTAAVSLTGDGNANVLIGGAGADILTGGLGADTFVIGQSGTAVDHIVDFHDAEQDKIDLTALLHGKDVTPNTVKLEVGTDPATGATIATVSVDQTGTGTAFTEVTVLDHYDGSGIDVLVDNTEHHIP